MDRSNRAIVNVATGRFVAGQQRLVASEHLHAQVFKFTDVLPRGSPDHSDLPYAFKAYALKEAIDSGYTTLLWCDACIKPARSLEPLWERIERDGYWIAENPPWNNWQWTAASAYADLNITEEENKLVPHVSAVAFGFDITTDIGNAIFEEFYRLARTHAFRGASQNVDLQAHPDRDVLGHRHDQTALSVIAHRLGCQLTTWPVPIAYAGKETDQTILIADGNYRSPAPTARSINDSIRYSQNDEQDYIVAHFNGRVGKFLDIGAYDGKKFSNVRRLLELGWSGYMVEPAPSVIPLLRANVAEFGERVQVITKAIGETSGQVEFFDNAGAVATTRIGHMIRWRGKERFSRCKVEQITPDELIDKTATDVDFVNIDVEGANLDVVRAMPWHRLPKVTLVCVEHERHKDQMLAILGGFGFKLIAENPENLILKR